MAMNPPRSIHVGHKVDNGEFKALGEERITILE